MTFFVSSVKLLFIEDTESTRSDIVVSEEMLTTPLCSSRYLAIFDKTPSESPTVPERIEAWVYIFVEIFFSSSLADTSSVISSDVIPKDSDRLLEISLYSWRVVVPFSFALILVRVVIGFMCTGMFPTTSSL